nr:MAG TPA: hypothetical protein [Bacteriophage sp.]
MKFVIIDINIFHYAVTLLNYFYLLPILKYVVKSWVTILLSNQ